ncbi:MAG: hypothetical protein V1703_02995 [Candidatus Altiarchaeota archaeon]
MNHHRIHLSVGNFPFHPPKGLIDLPEMRVFQVATENEKPYDDMERKFGLFSRAHATAEMPLNNELSRLVLFGLGLQPRSTYRYRHQVLKNNKTPMEVHFNEMLGGGEDVKYAMVSLIEPRGIGFRGFANPSVLNRLRDEIPKLEIPKIGIPRVGPPKLGYTSQSIYTFERTHFELGEIKIIMDHADVMLSYIPGQIGWLNTAVFEQAPEAMGQTMDTFNAFVAFLKSKSPVAFLGRESPVSMGGVAGPLTGMGELAKVRLIHKAPPLIVDLSIPDNYRDMMEYIRQGKVT